MSLVIAIKDKDRVILGSDKQVSCGGVKSHDAVKIWDLPEFPGAVMGSVGLVRATQIIQASQVLELNDLLTNGGPTTTFMINSVVPRILNLLETHGIKCDANQHTDMDCSTIPNSFIIAVGDKAWIISTDLCVTEIEDYAAIGSGEAVAWGCLFATKKDKNPFERIVTAINASAETTLYVDHAVDFASTKIYKNDCALLDKVFGFDKAETENATETKKKPVKKSTKKKPNSKTTKKDKD